VNTSDDLLQPSLAGMEHGTRKIYSTTVGYISSFFGGPIAGALVAAVNSWRLGRMRRDWPLTLGTLVVAAAVLLPAPLGIFEHMLAWLGESGLRFAWRLAGLAVFGVSYLLHRRYHRGMAVMGVAAPSGWLLGILAIVLGTVPLALALSGV
jgi:hypothetical protein